MLQRHLHGWILMGVVSNVLMTGACSLELAPNSKPASKYYTDRNMIELLNAISNDDVAAVSKCVSSGADPNGQGVNYMTPLHWAIRENSQRAFATLLGSGADPIQLYNRDYSIMSVTARNEDSAWLRLALERGDPNCRDPGTKFTPLFWAIRARNKDNIVLLINAGADINHRGNSGTTPLMFAAQLKSFDLAYDLLELGADYTLIDDFGRNLAYYSIDSESDETAGWRDKVIKFLSDRNEDLTAVRKKVADDRHALKERYRSEGRSVPSGGVK